MAASASFYFLINSSKKIVDHLPFFRCKSTNILLGSLCVLLEFLHIFLNISHPSLLYLLNTLLALYFSLSHLLLLTTLVLPPLNLDLLESFIDALKLLLLPLSVLLIVLVYPSGLQSRSLPNTVVEFFLFDSALKFFLYFETRPRFYASCKSASLVLLLREEFFYRNLRKEVEAEHHSL